MHLLQGSSWLCWPAAAAFVLAASAEAGTFWYVDADRSLCDGDGLTWDTAFCTLQDGLAAAASGDEIHVAQGTYYPDRDKDNPNGTGDREATFQLKSGVTLLGGFAGPEDPEERDPDLYPTILSGDLAGDDQPEFLNYEENSYHVVTASEIDSTAILDGFTIKGGNADGAARAGWGGGMHNSSASPTVIQCILEANWARLGGGIFGMDGAPTVSGSRFVGNFAELRGGGFYTRSDATVSDCEFDGNSAVLGGGMYISSDSSTVTDCRFSENRAADGGGMFNVDSSPTVTDCTFAGNTATNGNGGGIYFSSGNPFISNCTFENNEAIVGEADSTGQGGAIYGNGGSLTMTNSTFTGNRAVGGAFLSGNGGAINLWDLESTTFESCAFRSNQAIGGSGASGIGGGLAWAVVTPGDHDLTIANCDFVENTATGEEGSLSGASGGAHCAAGLGFATVNFTNATFIRNVATEGYGANGGLGFDSIDRVNLTDCLFAENYASVTAGALSIAGPVDGATVAKVTNCTFARNEAGEAAGGVLIGWDNDQQDVLIVNSVLWENSPDQIFVSFGTLDVQFSDIEGGWSGIGNIDTDPFFVDPDNGDHRLSVDSPCTDAGANNAVPSDDLDLDEDGDDAERTPIDLSGNPRFADNLDMADTGCGEPVKVDMGAYEYQGVPWHPMLVGDVDGDGIVGFQDVLQVLVNWGSCDPECCLADIDFTWEVNFNDLLLLLANWTT